MNLKQVIELCNAYQECLAVEEVLNKSICSILSCGDVFKTDLVTPIKGNIINCFCLGVGNDKYEEMVYNCLETNDPQELYNLFELMKRIYNG